MSSPESPVGARSTSITLVGGSGRSGTTLLRRLLGRHPKVCEVPEWRLPVDPGGLVDFYVAVSAAWTPLLFDAHYRRLAVLLRQVGSKGVLASLYRRAVHGSGLARRVSLNLDLPYGAVDASLFCPGYPQLAEALLDNLRSLEYRAVWTGSPFLSDGRTVLGGPFKPEALAAILGSFYRQVVQGTLQAHGGEHYVEKNTWYPLVFDRFLELVPEARLVNIWRDPRDVVCSMVEQRWAPSDLLSAARYYRAIMDRWYAVRSQLPVGSFLDVFYEELVTKPEDVLERIAAFAGIPLSPGPYGLSAGSIGRWQRGLRPGQVEQILPYFASELGEKGSP